MSHNGPSASLLVISGLSPALERARREAKIKTPDLVYPDFWGSNELFIEQVYKSKTKVHITKQCISTQFHKAALGNSKLGFSIIKAY